MEIFAIVTLLAGVWLAATRPSKVARYEAECERKHGDVQRVLRIVQPSTADMMLIADMRDAMVRAKTKPKRKLAKSKSNNKEDV